MNDRPTGTAAEMTRADALRALQWLREQHPDARLTTLLNPSEEAFVAVRVQIELPDGPAGGAHGVALAIENAEDRAIVRAMETLGYRRAEAAPAALPPSGPAEAPAAAEPRPAPVESSAAPAQPPARTQAEPQPAPAEAPSRPQGQQPAPLAGRSAQMGPPVMVRPRQPAPQPAPQQPRSAQGRVGLRPVPDIQESDARLEDVSWTEFWKWARARGFDSRDAVNDAIQRPMDGMTPREVRDLLKAYLGEEE